MNCKASANDQEPLNLLRVPRTRFGGGTSWLVWTKVGTLKADNLLPWIYPFPRYKQYIPMNPYILANEWSKDGISKKHRLKVANTTDIHYVSASHDDTPSQYFKKNMEQDNLWVKKWSLCDAEMALKFKKHKCPSSTTWGQERCPYATHGTGIFTYCIFSMCCQRRILVVIIPHKEHLGLTPFFCVAARLEMITTCNLGLRY